MKTMLQAIIVALVSALAFSAQAETGVLLKNGRRLTGKLLEWRDSTQEYVLTTDETTLPIPLAQVARVVVDKPSEFDQAVAQAKARQFEQAIPKLESIIRRYKRMNWDAEAALVLAEACLEANNPRKAVSAMESLFAVVSREQVPATLQMTYWKALLASGATDQLQKELDKVIGTGAPEMVAVVYVVRGNAFLKTGQEDEALSDFLKVITLFQNQKEVQPEALFRAADLLDKAGDPRGADLRQKLGKEYPGNPFAVKAAALAPPPVATPATAVTPAPVAAPTNVPAVAPKQP